MLKFSVITHPVDSHIITDAVTKAEVIVASQAMKDTEPYVPALTGAFSAMSRVEEYNGHAAITYNGPQARFLWEGKVMIDPNTGSTFAPLHGHKVATDRDLVYNTSMHQSAQSHWFLASQAQNSKKWFRIADKAVKNGL